MTPFGTLGYSAIKVSKCLPSWFTHAVDLLLRNCRFSVYMGDAVSSWRIQKSGLPQGSVLAPTLFNLYTNELPTTSCRRFIYADDICCISQAETSELDCTLTADLARITQYCWRWRLSQVLPRQYRVYSTYTIKVLSVNLRPQ